MAKRPWKSSILPASARFTLNTLLLSYSVTFLLCSLLRQWPFVCTFRALAWSDMDRSSSIMCADLTEHGYLVRLHYNFTLQCSVRRHILTTWYSSLHVPTCPCNRPFSDDVTHTRKFDYYSADHSWGGSMPCQMYYVLWENPTSTRIPACKLRLGIATHERTALFVEQRERFQLPFVATSCDLPSPRYSRLEITLSFQTAQSVAIRVSRPCIREFWQSWLDKGAQSDEPQSCW